MFKDYLKKYRVTAVLCFVGAVLILSTSFIYVRFPRKYCDIIALASAEHNIEPSLIRAVIFAESGFDSNAVSRAGAVGLMQIMPATAEYIARQRGIEFSQNMLLGPATNIDFGAYYLARLLRRFGNQREALAAYNAGEGNVSNWRALDLERIPFRETRNYVVRVGWAQRVYRFLINEKL